MTRENSINEIMDRHPDAIFVATTGKISRELYELRLKRGEDADDFYMMGSMGHAPDIAIGICIGSNKDIVVLNGDGAAAMRMGSMLRAGAFPIHQYILDNNGYDSTGGQLNAFAGLSLSLKNNDEEDAMPRKIVNVLRGCRKDLGRITIKPHEIVQRVYEKILS